ncbi:MAG: hypothetical protein IJL79_03940 [Candidatus Methanomethylophilaceae archaeon]|nr:hypothetical protein [Candidatus Methanomethylophilaceae archaeon]
MDSNAMKKAGVIAIILLLALYVAGYVIILVVLESELSVAVIYGAIGLLFIVWLSYEGWQRIKEIDEGLEDDCDNY